MDYFDPDYFDGTYFDTADEQPALVIGRGAPKSPLVVTPNPDADEAYLVLLT